MALRRTRLHLLESEGMDRILRGWKTVKRVAKKARKAILQAAEYNGVKNPEIKVFIDTDPRQPVDAWGRMVVYVKIPEPGRTYRDHKSWSVKLSIESSKIPTGGEDKKGGPLGGLSKAVVVGGKHDGGDISGALKRPDPSETVLLYWKVAATKAQLDTYKSTWNSRKQYRYAHLEKGYTGPAPIDPFLSTLKTTMKRAGFALDKGQMWGKRGRYAFGGKPEGGRPKEIEVKL